MKKLTKYMSLAEHFSTWSKDTNTKVGSVIIGKNGQVLSQGYNGFPRGVSDTLERLSDRNIKNTLTVHAEANALYNAIYNGANLENSVMYVYGLDCCHECAKAIIQSGIRTVIAYTPIEKPNWKESIELAQQLFKETGVQYLKISKEEFDGNK